MDFSVEIGREVDGRWIAEIASIPGALSYGHSPEQALEAVKTLAAEVIEDRMAHREALPIPASADRLLMSVRGRTATVVEGSTPGLWVGCVEDLHGVHTQGETLEELYLSLCEVVELVTEDGSAPGLLPEIQP